MAKPTRDEVIADIAKVLSGLQVPVSLGMHIGTARDPWTRLKQQLTGFGWTDDDEIETALHKILDNPSQGD